jgi:mannose-1-phosphate guanylyltransferase
MPSMPDAVVLCGGAGLRLRSVTGGAPKPMASIVDRPFLEVLLKQLSRHGVSRAVLAVGYQEDVIRSHFGTRAFGVKIAYSSETRPLGTGGALRNALDVIQSDFPLVMNGDSYTDADLQLLVSQHHHAKADASVVVVASDERNDCGLVRVDESGNLMEFEEKQFRPGLKYLNAGIYLISRKLIADIPSGIQISIEREVFPGWLSEGKRIRAFLTSAACLDIGTPERYQKAQHALANAEEGGRLVRHENG